MAKRVRDYAKEYREYQGTPEQLKNQAKRHAARREYIKANPGVDMRGKDVNHKKRIAHGGTNALSNLEAEKIKDNRNWRKGLKGKL